MNATTLMEVTPFVSSLFWDATAIIFIITIITYFFGKVISNCFIREDKFMVYSSGVVFVFSFIIIPLGLFSLWEFSPSSLSSAYLLLFQWGLALFLLFWNSQKEKKFYQKIKEQQPSEQNWKWGIRLVVLTIISVVSWYVTKNLSDRALDFTAIISLFVTFLILIYVAQLMYERQFTVAKITLRDKSIKGILTDISKDFTTIFVKGKWHQYRSDQVFLIETDEEIEG